MTCSFPFCSRPVPKEGYCVAHAAKYGNVKPKSEPKPIPKVSQRKKKEEAEYLKLKKQMMKESDKCEAKLAGCTRVAVDLHHVAGRGKDKTVNRANLLRVCRSCHIFITDNPLTAIDLGLSKSRHKTKTNILPQK